MKRKTPHKQFFQILDYSFEIYKKWFWKFTLAAFFIHLPFFLGMLMLEEKGYTDSAEAGGLILALAAAPGLLYLIASTLFAGFIMNKVYSTVTERNESGRSQLKWKFVNLLGKLTGVLAIGAVGMVFGVFTIANLRSTLFILMFLIWGRERIVNWYPEIEIPVATGFADWFFMLSINTFLMLWGIQLLMRWMFGFHVAFIQGASSFGSIKKSFQITKGSVVRLFGAMILFFMFQTFMVLLGVGILWGGSFLIPDAWGGRLQISSVFSIVYAILYPFLIIFTTTLYVRMRSHTDALALEFKMLKMMEKEGKQLKQEFLSMDIISFETETVSRNPSPQQPFKFGVAGIFTRFVSTLIDVCFAALLFLIVLWLNRSFSHSPMLLREQDLRQVVQDSVIPYAQALYIGMLISITHFFLIGTWELIAGGATPGKIWMGLQVLSVEGLKPTKRQLLLRNLMRIVDGFPGVYWVGFMGVATHKSYRGFAERWSKTMVVRKVVEKDHEKQAQLMYFGSNNPPRENRYPVSETELAVLQEFLQRKDLEEGRKRFFEQNLYRYFAMKFQVQEKYENPYQFFNEIVSMNDRRKR